MRIVFLVVAACSAAAAQQWTVGASAGFGNYGYSGVYSPAGHAKAGIGPRWGFALFLDEDKYEHFGGEFRYFFQEGDTELKVGGSKTARDAESHTWHYDVMAYAFHKEARLRPYAALGAGAKWYRVKENSPGQPFANYAILAYANDVQPVISGGGGVKYRLSRQAIVRGDFREYTGPFPEKLVIPAPGGRIRGWLHDFVPSFGFGYSF